MLDSNDLAEDEFIDEPIDEPIDIADDEFIDESEDIVNCENTDEDINTPECEKILTFTVEEYDNATRVDKYASAAAADISRSLISQYIDEGRVLINSKPCKASKKVETGDVITINVPPLKELDVKPENIPIDIVYEDDDILIVNKPKGMVVHPAPGHYEGTLVNALMYHMGDKLSGINGVLRPGIVHRIDRDTTGLLVICKNDYAHNYIADLLKTHDITRTYHTIVKGNILEDGTVHARLARDPNNRKKMAVTSSLNGKDAITHYHVVKNYKGYTYITCNLETGRTHQIRAHMASIGHPVLGDDIYGGADARIKVHLEGQSLHAKTLGFVHPRSGKYVEFDSPLPDYFNKVLTFLENM